MRVVLEVLVMSQVLLLMSQALVTSVINLVLRALAMTAIVSMIYLNSSGTTHQSLH
jgi:hypothetical protein